MLIGKGDGEGGQAEQKNDRLRQVTLTSDDNQL